MYDLINPQLRNYVETEITALYKTFDKAHNICHMKKVIHSSLLATKEYDVDKDIIYAAAALHDVGIRDNREYHHLFSGKFVEENELLPKLFNKDEITIIKEAVEDHRASNRNNPRSIYGKIVAVADRDLEITTTIKRSYDYALNILPSSDDQEHFENVYTYLHKKYGVNGTMVMWLSTKETESNLKAIEEIVEDKELFLKTYVETLQIISEEKIIV